VDVFSWKKLFGSFLLTAVTAGLLAPTMATSATANNQCWEYKTSERSFKLKINQERAELGLAKLRLDPELSKVALKHTNEMVAKNELYHTSSQQLKNRVTNWNVLGENVGVGGGVDSLHKAFMNSPAHAANVLNSGFKHVGVGVVKKGDRLWVTIIFEAVTNPGTTLPMPKC